MIVKPHPTRIEFVIVSCWIDLYRRNVEDRSTRIVIMETPDWLIEHGYNPDSYYHEEELDAKLYFSPNFDFRRYMMAKYPDFR